MGTCVLSVSYLGDIEILKYCSLDNLCMFACRYTYKFVKHLNSYVSWMGFAAKSSFTWSYTRKWPFYSFQSFYLMLLIISTAVK